MWTFGGYQLCLIMLGSIGYARLDKAGGLAWDLLEGELGEGPYLLGESYSAADPYLLMITNWHEDTEALCERNPKLARLCNAVKARSAVKRIGSQHFPD
ncbi:MAG: glutathione S-transferase [Gammaproteobacteria bacterium]|jgi:glutathione S-transferase